MRTLLVVMAVAVVLSATPPCRSEIDVFGIGPMKPTSAHAARLNSILAANPRALSLMPIEKSSSPEVAGAIVRANKARAEGNRALAAREWRKVIAHCEDQLQAAQKGNICSPEPFQAAHGALAIARAWLADLENRRDDLRVELPKVIAYYELRVWRYQRLLELKAITEEEAKGALKDLGKELHYVQSRLAGLGGGFVLQEKTGKEDHP